MTIEKEIFKKTKIDIKKIREYGFKKENKQYKYTKLILDNTMEIKITINEKGQVQGKIYDILANEEYTSFRIKNATGKFARSIADEFENLLEDIKNKCFIPIPFIYEQTNRIVEQIKIKYNDWPQFEWEKFPGYATFKNKTSQKWYAIIMNINMNKLEPNKNKEVEIINLKLNPNKIQKLLNKKGFYKAYHMNKTSWITVLLNNTVPDSNLMKLIDESYSNTITTKNLSNNEWLIPANPKYFDIEKELDKKQEILWKQSTNIKINDIVYLYVGAPYKKIMYKLKVEEINIPYEYKSKNLKMQKVMKLSLLEKYKNDKLTLNKIKEFGINSVRGPRYINKELSEYINQN